MKFILLMIPFILVACNSDEPAPKAVKLNTGIKYEHETPELTEKQKLRKKITDILAKSDEKQIQALKKDDDFSDLKALDKKDGACDTEEDIEKKIMEQAKSKPALLQGGDTGCTVE